jgi:hypothetical protein
MSNVAECLKLYVNDDDVDAAMFRAIMLDAAARDAVDAAGATPERSDDERAELIGAMIEDRLKAIAGTLYQVSVAIGALTERDDQHDEQLEALSNRIESCSRAVFSNGPGHSERC